MHYYTYHGILRLSFILCFVGMISLSCSKDNNDSEEMEIEPEERERGLSTCPETLEHYCPASGPCSIFKVVEEMPRFFHVECESLVNASIAEKKACAEIKMLAYLDSTIIYPAIAKENQIEGLGIVQFIVRDSIGCLEDIQILREDDFGFGKELQRVVATMPPFVVGRQRGRTVNVLYTLPYNFELD